MVYTSPTKVARVAHLKMLSLNDSQIATELGIHRTTVGRILKCFKKSADPYHVTPKTGRPRKLDDRDVRVA